MNRETKIAERVVMSRFHMGVFFKGNTIEISVPFRPDQQLSYEVTNTLAGIERYFDGVEPEIKGWFASSGIRADVFPSTISEREHIVFRTIRLDGVLDVEQKSEFVKFMDRT